MSRDCALTKNETLSLIQATYRDLAAEVDGGFAPSPFDEARDLNDQIAASEDRAAELRKQLADHNYGDDVAGTAKRRLRSLGLSWSEVTEPQRHDLLSGVARALLEQQRLWSFRIDERLLPYNPADQIFALAHHAAADIPPAALARPDPAIVGPTVHEAVERYLSSNKSTWVPKTYNSRQRRLAYLVEHHGADTRVASISAHQVREFRDAVCRLRADHNRDRNSSFSSRQTENKANQIASKTASLIFDDAKAFWRWAKSEEGYVPINPAEDVRIKKPKTVNVQPRRRPFTADELTTIFSAPLFTGCHSAHRRFEPGSLILKDANYWIPLLGFFTGARLGELVQLHVEDVKVDGPIPHISITSQGGGALGSDEHKHVKSQAGVRLVPLHPDLMALGFAEFISRRLKEKRTSKRVFWQVAYGADGQASTVFSKWFARLLDKRGLSDPTLVFHSFRHNAEDSFRNASILQQITDRIIGHSDGSVSAGYGEGVWLETAYEAVRKMKLRIDLPASLGILPPSSY